jgi:hypothetical protein
MLRVLHSPLVGACREPLTEEYVWGVHQTRIRPARAGVRPLQQRKTSTQSRKERLTERHAGCRSFRESVERDRVADNRCCAAKPHPSWKRSAIDSGT